MEASSKLSLTLPYRIRFVFSRAPSEHRAVRPGETYTLSFTGAEVAVTWGRADGSRVQEADENGKEERPRLIIPGGAYVSFTAQEEELPWPRRQEWEAEHGFRSANYWEKIWRDKAPWRATRFRENLPTQDHIKQIERSPGAPALSAKLETEPTVAVKSNLEVMIRISYDGVYGRDGEFQRATRPFTFRTSTIWGIGQSGSHDWVYRRSRKDGEPHPWEGCNSAEMGDLGIYEDADDTTVRVAEHRDFACLCPGESWTARLRTVRPESFYILDEVAPGDVFLCGFSGAEDHSETVVTVLPTGEVSGPGGNAGRPKLIVPSTGPVEFRTVEKE